MNSSRPDLRFSPSWFLAWIMKRVSAFACCSCRMPGPKHKDFSAMEFKK